MEKTKKSNKEKVDRHDFMVAWSTGMNDYQIAQRLGVSLQTVMDVKADLKKENNS
ncbi:MAG: helix-turn-helix domain-containing protein [Halanaerobiaceae bacterium]